MNKIISIIAIPAVLLFFGCANQQRDSEKTSQNLLRENEQRLHELETNVNSLNSQVAQLNNRVYEVRTRSGQKTSMQVVPVGQPVQGTAVAASNPAPVAAPNPPVINHAQAAKPAPKAKPKGRTIDPKSRPAPLQAQSPAQTPARATAQTPAGASGRIGHPENIAGPSGQIAPANAQGDLGLPPADLPPSHNPADQGLSVTGPASNVVAVPTGNAQTPIPVPVIPQGDLSLPPEDPNLPPVSATQPVSQATPAPTAKAAPASAAPTKGEEAAYRAALNAARSGRTAESIRLFRNFLQQYPNGRYAANADYWIGECLYSEGKYKDALSQFQTVNNTYPRHHKNADALLKAAITLNRLGDKAGADQKFKTLLANFPNSDAARRARAMGAR